MVYVFHVDGYEDTELIAPLDMLSRAGIPFTRVGVTGFINCLQKHADLLCFTRIWYATINTIQKKFV